MLIGLYKLISYNNIICSQNFQKLKKLNFNILYILVFKKNLSRGLSSEALLHKNLHPHYQSEILDKLNQIHKIGFLHFGTVDILGQKITISKLKLFPKTSLITFSLKNSFIYFLNPKKFVETKITYWIHGTNVGNLKYLND